METAGAANFTTNYGDDAYVLLYSDRRTDGLILDSLISKRPASDLIPKVVNGLLGHRTKGRWDNAQENAFILLALKHYFDVFENATPDFVARAERAFARVARKVRAESRRSGLPAVAFPNGRPQVVQCRK